MRDIQIISAPSILGLRPTGVEKLAETLLDLGIVAGVESRYPVIHVETLNQAYNPQRDSVTNCLNPQSVRDFSITLSETITGVVSKNRFALVLGGDCSILIGAMAALKAKGNYGLIFLDAHADFYEPEKSTTGEVADMDLAIVTGRGPSMLTDINVLKPYVNDENVIHIGQRDWEETQEYGSQDIRATGIECVSLDEINSGSFHEVVKLLVDRLNESQLDGYWIHFDTDVLSDDINPAVDYRLPGGLLLDQLEPIVKSLLDTGKIVGITITIFNPRLDQDGEIAKSLNESIIRMFTKEGKGLL